MVSNRTTSYPSFDIFWGNGLPVNVDIPSVLYLWQLNSPDGFPYFDDER